MAKRSDMREQWLPLLPHSVEFLGLTQSGFFSPPLAVNLCTTLLSTVDSLQQLKSYISPQIRVQEMELRVHFMSKSTSSPMSFTINPLFSKTGNLSPYPVTCCHLLIEPTTCELLCWSFQRYNTWQLTSSLFKSSSMDRVHVHKSFRREIPVDDITGLHFFSPPPTSRVGGRLPMGAVIAFFDPWCSTSCSGLQAKTFPSFYSEPVYLNFSYFFFFSELVSPDSHQTCGCG